jgi:hypothetical protein
MSVIIRAKIRRKKKEEEEGRRRRKTWSSNVVYPRQGAWCEGFVTKPPKGKRMLYKFTEI